MREREYLLPAFLLSFGLMLLLLLLGRAGALFFLQDSLQTLAFPINTFLQNKTAPQQNMQFAALQKENQQLEEKLNTFSQLQADNKALRDQFQTTNPAPRNVLPATVVGENGAVPNISFPEEIVINKGKVDGVKKGQAVVEGQQLLGTIGNVSTHFSQVILITNRVSTFSVRDSTTGAIGVVRGMGSGGLLLDNVLLSDSITVNDSITTSGSQNLSGQGIPSGLILGKVISIDKKPTNLFQSAQLLPLVAFDHLITVFVIKED